MEHAIRNVVNNNEVYKWFTTDGVYTSCHDLISRILQFDVDGDQLNVVGDQTIISVAERNIEEYDVVPLFYDATKAAAEQISKVALFNGLKRAHLYSNIGEISNMLTRLWNRDKPDREAAALLVYVNNLRIDGAKCGAVNEYTNYPEVTKQINKATGGSKARMPFFFQFSKNGRSVGKEKNYSKPNKSTMNRICAAFDDIGNINMNYAGVSPFNYQMLLRKECYEVNQDIIDLFCDLDGMSLSTDIALSETVPGERENIGTYEILAEIIYEELTGKFGSIEKCYPYIVKELFSGEGQKKPSHKRMFWRIFGNIALEILKENLANCKTCSYCKTKIPAWAGMHNCSKNNDGFFVCEGCGKQFARINSKQCRCDKCQKRYKKAINKSYMKRYREKKEELEKERSTTLLSYLTKTY